jgi:hypothetical protein
MAGANVRTASQAFGDVRFPAGPRSDDACISIRTLEGICDADYGQALR